VWSGECLVECSQARLNTLRPTLKASTPQQVLGLTHLGRPGPGRRCTAWPVRAPGPALDPESQHPPHHHARLQGVDLPGLRGNVPERSATRPGTPRPATPRRRVPDEPVTTTTPRLRRGPRTWRPGCGPCQWPTCAGPGIDGDRKRRAVENRSKSQGPLHRGMCRRARSMLASRRKAAAVPAGQTFDVWGPDSVFHPRPDPAGAADLGWITRRKNLVVRGPPAPGRPPSSKLSASRPSKAGSECLVRARGPRRLDPPQMHRPPTRRPAPSMPCCRGTRPIGGPLPCRSASPTWNTVFLWPFRLAA
jgi:hypothetical protein